MIGSFFASGHSPGQNVLEKTSHECFSSERLAMPGVFPEVFLGTVSWVDFDNDADVDLFLAAGEIQNFRIIPITAMYENEAGTLTRLDFPFQPMSGGPAAWGDLDNDGDLDLLLTGNSSPDGTIPNTTGSIAKLYKNNSANKNSDPNPPTRLQARVEADRVFLQWNRARDAETPQLGLSYNLRVGTEPGGVKPIAQSLF